MSELRLQIDSTTIAGLLYNGRVTATGFPTAVSRRILCLHGQVDNAGTFASLAPLLAEVGHTVFAMDLSGHGRSSWRPMYDPTFWALEVLQTLDALGWSEPVVLLAHSFGTAVATLVAGAYPERVSSVVLIEGLGLWDQCHTPDQSAGAVLRQRLSVAVAAKRHGPKKRYPSAEAAVQARLAGLKNFPTDISISESALRPIVDRGIVARPDGGVEFCHDPAVFSGTSFACMSHADARDILGRMPDRCLLIHCGSRTYPDIPTRTEARKDAVRGLQMHVFEEESHHLHADRPELVSPIILDFLAGGRASGVEARL